MSATIEKRARIAAGAERAVDVGASGARLERLHRLVEQHGNMDHPVDVSAGPDASRSARNRRTRMRASSRCV